MKTERKILLAFILNISFSIFELIGGLFTNSIAIISDAIHDFGNAISIGISGILEKISKKQPNGRYTYGYARFSILGVFITTMILTVGSILVIIGGVERLFNPEQINYNGMIVFAVFGLIVNFMAAYFTKDGSSLNQRSVNLHMLEDVLGWLIVLIGSIIMKFTNINYIDSIMSICVSIYILFHSLKNLKSILDLFLEKSPNNTSIDELQNHIEKIDGVLDIHHFHIWSMDGNNNYATVHIKSDCKDLKSLKKKIRDEFKEHNINHVTIETEDKDELCNDEKCHVDISSNYTHNHHHKKVKFGGKK